MKTYWLIGFIVLFILLSIISGIVEMTYIGEAEASRIQLLLQPELPESTIPIIGTAVAWVNLAWDWLKNLWHMFWFDYAFFTGGYIIIRYFFIAISVGIIFSIILALRGTSNS